MTEEGVGQCTILEDEGGLELLSSFSLEKISPFVWSRHEGCLYMHRLRSV